MECAFFSKGVMIVYKASSDHFTSCNLIIFYPMQTCFVNRISLNVTIGSIKVPFPLPLLDEADTIHSRGKNAGSKRTDYLQSILDILCKACYTNSAKHTLQNGDGFVKTKIPELRKARKVSQEELALAVGVTRQTITSIEVGKYTASLPLAYKIAKYFGLSIEEIFDFSDLEEKENE